MMHCPVTGVHRSLCGAGGSRGLHHQLPLQPAVHRPGGPGADLRSHGEAVWFSVCLVTFDCLY